MTTSGCQRPRRPRRPRRPIARLALVTLFAALALSFAACDVATFDETTEPKLGDITLERLDGLPLDLSELSEASVINLWATWCAPCRAELPAFNAVATRLESIDGAPSIVGVNVGDTRDTAAQLVSELQLSFDQALDPQAEIQRALRIPGLPATILVEPDGTILAIRHGELTESELNDLLDEFFDLGLAS